MVLAVPHAGRVYPPALLSESRLPKTVLEQLADRDADRLVGPAVTAGARAIVATRARAWLDLNRHPREMEPGAIDPKPAAGTLLSTAKSRGGLGIVPTRVAGAGEIRRAAIGSAELSRRIAEGHDPYHAAIAVELAAARAAFGYAILIDVHTMPSVEGALPPRIVVGDLGGRAAARTITERALACASDRWRTALNEPYAGGYTLERHGRPHRQVHALQIEFDRALYIGPDGRSIAARIAMLGGWLASLVARLSTPQKPAIAAE